MSNQHLVDSYHWHQGFDFGQGLITRSALSPQDTQIFAHALWDGVSLAGLSVIDIGAWNGAYSFAAKRLGAARVVACDHIVWDDNGAKGRQTFELARDMLGLDVEALDMDVPDIDFNTIGIFDVVLFSGVFYHLLHPVLAVQKIASCTRHAIVIETHQDMLDSKQPAMAFYPNDSLNGDQSNWWGPNPQFMYEMLLEFGFQHVFYQDSPGWRGGEHGKFRNRGIYHAFRDRRSLSIAAEEKRPNEWRDMTNATVRDAIFDME